MLKHKARLAFLWGGAEILLRHGITVIVTIVLARLLAPELFGTVALLSLIVGVALALVDGGFSAALVQSAEVSHTDESTVFWFNFLMAGGLAVVLQLGAPVIASFYGQPVLSPLVSLLALYLVLGALGAIHTALLSRALEFRIQMKIGVLASVVSGVVAIVMAWAGYGIWSIAAQGLVATGLTTALLWMLNGWRPSFVFSMASLRRLFSFGGYVLLINVLDAFYSRLSSLLIGKLYGARELGLYVRAEGARDIPMGVMANVISSVAFPVFSAAAGDRVALRDGMRRSVRGMMMLNVPMMLGLYAVAQPLMLMMFGAQWLSAVPMLQVLCLACLFLPLWLLNVQVLKALGLSRLFFRLEILMKLLGCLFILVGASFGVMGVAWGMALFSLVSFIVHGRVTGRYLGYGVRAQWGDCWPVVLLALPMMIAVMGVERYWHPASQLLKVMVLVPAGAVLFLLMAWSFKVPHLVEAVAWLRRSPVEGKSDSGCQP